MAGRRERPTSATLVEREAELHEIDDAIAGARAANGRLLVVEGPAGIGKTALLTAARERAEALDVAVLPARGAELEREFPYGVVRQLLEQLVRGTSADRREQLLAGSAAAASSVLLGSTPAPSDPVDQGFTITHALYWVVANLAAERPVILLVDDAHTADVPTLRFLVYLARRLEGHPASVIATLRTGEDGSDPNLSRELKLTPVAHIAAPAALTADGVARVLSSRFGAAPDPEFVQSCLHSTAGNPFFVDELARALRADGIAPTAQASQGIVDATPPTIAQTMLARLARLPDDASALARAIAVLGRDATLPRATGLADLDGARGFAALDALVAAELVAPDEQLEFRHPIVRTVIYDAIPRGARSGAHEQVAALLRSEGAELDKVAAHLLAVEPVGSDETIVVLREAAAHALAVGAPASAATYLARALAEAPERPLRVAVLMELGTAEQFAGVPSAPARFEEVRRLTEDPETRARARFQQATMSWYAGDWQRFVSSLDDSLEDLARPEATLRLQVEVMRAGASMYDTRLVAGFDERRPTLERLVTTQPHEARPLAFILATCGAARDEPTDRVRELVALGWDGGRYLTDGDSIDLLPQGIGALQLVDRLDDADALIEGGLAHARATGSVTSQLVSRASFAMGLCIRGDLAPAAAEMRWLLERAIELQLGTAIASVLWYCSEVLVERDDVADLATLLETFDLAPFAEIVIGALLLATRARLRFAAGRRAAAIDDIRRSGAINDALGFTNYAQCACWRSTLALMLVPDQRDEAVELTRAELETARRSGQYRRIGIALRALGLIEQDPSLLEEAVAVLADSPARLEYARGLVELGAALRRRGERAAARQPLRDGLDLATRCGATRLAERARTELAATGARPRRELITGRDALTPSELRVSQLAADGRTSQEIAQTLFITTRTVDTHLGHTYVKLGINSRRELAAALHEEPSRLAQRLDEQEYVHR